ncbi:MAG: DsbA family protein [Chromatiales bacterium]|nr:DsbA family protein [Chromatiales bacterium]
MATVSFYFDCSTAASYVASVRLAEAALRTAATIDWRPVLPGDLPPAAPAGEAEARYARKDLGDWARFCGVRLAPDDAAPGPAEAAARFLASLAGDPRQRAAVEAWFGSLHYAGAPDLDAVAAAAGREARAIAAAGADPQARARLTANARELEALGGWRTPSFVVAGELFVGHERLSLVELALTQASERRIVPPGAHSQVVAGPPAAP